MYRFDEDINFRQTGPNLFSGAISTNWSINGIPNGGYLITIMASAMMKFSDRSSTPIVTANYLSRCAPGEALVSVESIAESKQFRRLEARLTQGGNEKIRALGTFADGKLECFLKQYESEPPQIAPPDECVKVPALPGYTLFENADVRLDPGSAGWLTGAKAEKSEQRGWIRFTDRRLPDALSVILAADAFPPAVFVSKGPLGWVPTVEFSVSLREMPATEWLCGVFRTRFVNCGLLEEDGEIWDQSGEVVAVSRQIAQFRPAG